MYTNMYTAFYQPMKLRFVYVKIPAWPNNIANRFLQG